MTAYSKYLIRMEKLLYSKLYKMFNKISDRVGDEVLKNTVLVSEVAIEKAVDEVVQQSKAEYEKLILTNSELVSAASISNTIKQIEKTKSFVVGTSIDYSKISQKVLQSITGSRIRFVDQSIRNVSTLMISVLRKGYVEGKGINDISENLRKDFPQYSKSRAKIIARTEINGASNQACYETASELNVKYIKWITAKDERVRYKPRDKADHRVLDGQIIKLGDKFSNGLLYPHDTSSSKFEEVAGCRCTIIPYLIPYGYKAPHKKFFYEKDLIRIA